MRTLRWLPWLGLLAFAFAAHAQDTKLIAYGSTWQYLDDGSNQGTSWRAVGFNDSAWASGPAQLGYGDGDEATVTGYVDTDPVASGVQKNATTYFRKTFSVADPAQFNFLNLSVLYDDAAAVFINGVEVARTANLAAGAAYNTFATGAAMEDTRQTWALVPSLLVAGTNTIAVEIHQQAAASSDLSFDLQLVGVPGVIRGPYLHMNNATGVTLRWRTFSATDSVVWIGTTQGALTSVASDATLTTDHELRLTGLQSDTKYYYAVGHSSGALAGNNAEHFFRTAPVPGTDRPMRVWVLGDAGTATGNQRAVRDAYYSSAAYSFNDAVLLLGDNAYTTGTDTEYQNALFAMYPTVLRQSPLWSCLGNHETAEATSGVYSGVPYFDIFSFPTAAECGGYVSGTERYFSWDFGNVHFISLDAQTTDATLRANMLAWLDADLAALSVNKRRWIIALWHHPPYTKGSHNSDTEAQLVWTRENLVPRFEDAGVDLVLAGHSHSYERSWFIDGFVSTPTAITSGTVIDGGNGRADGNGVYGKDYGGHLGAVYMVAGSSGQVSGGSLNHPVMFSSINQLGSVILDIDGNRLDAKFINSDGAIADYFSIEKGPVVTVTTPLPQAAEYGPVTGQIRVARSGATADPLSVQATLAGTAPGSRYSPITLPVTIPAGATTSLVNVTPLPNAVVEGAQTVTLTAAPNVEYRLGATTSGSVTIGDLPAGAPPIAAWHLAKFGIDANNEAVRGDTRDPDGDGVTNVFEYALNLEPLDSASASLPSWDATSGYLVLRLQTNPAASDLTFSVQANGDLANQAGWNSSDITILQDTATLLEVRDNVPIGSTPRRFIRLQVTRQ
jgi:hypothetical protein